MTIGSSPYRDRQHTPQEAPHLALPLGGIGTGNVALCADGSLRQWQLHNIGNHLGELPGSFFSLRVSRVEPPSDAIRILQSRPPIVEPTPLVNDDAIPSWLPGVIDTFGPVQQTHLSATYPFARIVYEDAELPLSIQMEAFTPLVPFDVSESSLPAALFEFTLHNHDTVAVHGALGASLLNAVGWDGITPFDGVRAQGLGGNWNRVSRDSGHTGVILESTTLPMDAPGAGQMMLIADHPAASVLQQFSRPEEFRTFLESLTLAEITTRSAGRIPPNALRHGPTTATGPSAAGATWLTGLAIPFVLAPDQQKVIRVAIAWNFPNRYASFEQFGPVSPDWGRSRFWLGNAYSTRFPDAESVAVYVMRGWDGLRAESLGWTDVLVKSSLSDDAVEHLAAQAATLRSPTCFQAANGRFYGFEGTLGASTVMWNASFGGSCPLNCTHVWNYAQFVAALFPALEINMRDTEFEVMQAPDGSLPHRVVAPDYLPQLWNVPIGGPEQPALDGMLGAILKSYREVRAGAGAAWLERTWPRLKALLEYIEATWDLSEDGILSGIQPSTHDIDLRGTNPFIGGLWLAALRAAEEMARIVGDELTATRCADRFERASKAYDDRMFNGEYFEQVLEPSESRHLQWETGCLSDQLLGQWWAHELGLGYIFPADHVRSALRAIVRHNLRHGFEGFEHGYRVYADGDDSGLLLCTWPRGGRPEAPVRYADEVWSGIEYQVAASCLREGLDDEAEALLKAVWRRHDGRRRNPYNEIECGDHYIRSLSGWSVIAAQIGADYHAGVGTLRITRPREGVWPIVCGSGLGVISIAADSIAIECTSGSIELSAIDLAGETRNFQPPVTLHAGDEWHAPDTRVRATTIDSKPIG